MKFIKPGAVEGVCRAPSSKSHLQRAIASAFLAEGRSEIAFSSLCDDSRAALKVVEALGASVRIHGDRLIIEKGNVEPAALLNCGESGLCLRMFAPIACLWDQEITLGARGSLLFRPVSMLEAGLRNAGAHCQSRDGLPPLIVRGPLAGGRIHLDGAISSQHVSGFLLALPRIEADSLLIVSNLKSTPYIELTLAVMAAFGVTAEPDFAEGRFLVRGGQRYRPRSFTIEGDWSGAAFLLVAGAVAGNVTVTEINPDSLQPDRGIVKVLEECGAKLRRSSRGLAASRGSLRAFEFDAEDAPDLFPPLAALACYCHGTSRIRGAGRLRHKESSRAEALADVLGRMGAAVRLDNDTLTITGKTPLGGRVSSHHDHRIAMAAAVAALGSRDGVGIVHPECVAKSYPQFFEDLERLKNGE